jgi:hypothetical protein
MHVMLCPASSIFFPSLRPYVCTTGSFLSQNLITLLLLVHLGFLSEPTGTYSLLHNSLLFLHNKAVLQARCCICCLFYSDYFLDLLFNPEDEGDLFVLNISWLSHDNKTTLHMGRQNAPRIVWHGWFGAP